MIKKNSTPGDPDSFEVASYVNHNVRKMRMAIDELEIDEEDIPFSAKKRIKDELYSFIDKLEKAKDLNKAKRIVRDFYNYCNNIDDHPVFVTQSLNDTKDIAIEQLNDAFNDVMDERINPFVKMKAKSVFNRYREMILKARTEEEVETLAERGCDALNELY